jgi:hypothetical protein
MSKRIIAIAAVVALVSALVGWGWHTHWKWHTNALTVQQYTALAGPFLSAKVGGSCPGPFSCNDPHCERCTPIDIHLPRTAGVHDVKCIGTRWLPNPDPSWLNDPTKSFQYGPNLRTWCSGASDYSDFLVIWTGNPQVASGYFRNWAGDIDRYVEVKVTYSCDPTKDNCTPPGLHIVDSSTH